MSLPTILNTLTYWMASGNSDLVTINDDAARRAYALVGYVTLQLVWNSMAKILIVLNSAVYKSCLLTFPIKLPY